ncbi:hypothetical protein QZJ86_13575 [Methylomonas montana]|uniref:hypothetical protein n=1 Tax=Methylomonas montana TaxID=3058963 RepID=UPI002659F43A|nr:hypothetical protein [Methylomonas montana]WKJ89052.1 hypothetical protein QZJ86_13575 [Methylomonas montana]
MKHFGKTLMAAALLAGAGAANASIATGSATLSEAFLSVYDKSQALTFTLDLGLTNGDLIANVGNASYTKSFDLSAYALWNTFSAGLDASQTVFTVAVGNGSKQLATSAGAPAAYTNLTVAAAAGTGIKNHAGAINGGALADNPGETVSNTAANLSSLVADSDTANTGQHNQLNTADTLWGTKSDAAANIAYGSAGNFFYLNGTAAPVLTAGKWTLAGNSLSYGPAVAAVPLPAAVWMFGAGLMGVLRMTRRKHAAA